MQCTLYRTGSFGAIANEGEFRQFTRLFKQKLDRKEKRVQLSSSFSALDIFPWVTLTRTFAPQSYL